MSPTPRSENTAGPAGANLEQENATPALQHARGFLRQVRVGRSVEALAKELIGQATRDATLAEAFMRIQGAFEGRDLLDAEQWRTLHRTYRPDDLDLPTAPGWIRPAILSGYLRARDSLTPEIAAKILTDPHSALSKAASVVDGMEPDFVGELVTEAAIEASRDPAFARRLSDAADEMRPMVERLYTENPPSAVAKAAGVPGTGWRCTITSGGRTEPISCWVIVVIIIVIVVTKK